MATYRGFVRSLQVREDGWVEFVLQAVHAANATKTFFISNLDGELETAHRRLSHLSLLRDALIRVLPVELEYRTDERAGVIVEDITVYPRPSIAGRIGTQRVEGTVIGVAISDRGPEHGVSPYVDEADLAGITMLSNDGTVSRVLLDLQRPDPMTAQAMLALLQEAHRTRRPVAVLLDSEFRDSADPQHPHGPGGRNMEIAAASSPTEKDSSFFIQACEWITVPDESLEYVYAFVERLGQRYESYASSEAEKLSYVRVLYTTTPDQTPEGDVSDNGSFAPATREAWVHSNSPLLTRLEAALRDSLKVKLGLYETHVHEVELVSLLGSAARPIWICTSQKALPAEEGDGNCANQPTIKSPSGSDLTGVPVSFCWKGDAYYTQGVWRFVVESTAACGLLIDGAEPCCCSSGESSYAGPALEYGRTREATRTICHAYLEGMHQIQLTIKGRTCEQPFRLSIYRIR